MSETRPMMPAGGSGAAPSADPSPGPAEATRAAVLAGTAAEPARPVAAMAAEPARPVAAMAAEPPRPAAANTAEPPRPAAPRPLPAGANFPGPAAFRASAPGPEDRLIAQVAFAMAAESGTPPRDAEAIQALRDQATATLSDFAFRYLHNRVEEIRKEAAAEAATGAARGPGFLRLVLANLVALALGGGALLALAGNPHLLARLGGH